MSASAPPSATPPRPGCRAGRITRSRSPRWWTSSEFRAADRARARALFGVAADAPVIGWVGRLDRKKRVEDFIRAAALVAPDPAGCAFRGDRRPRCLHARLCAGASPPRRLARSRRAARLPRRPRRRAGPPGGARPLRLAVAPRGHAACHRRSRRREPRRDRHARQRRRWSRSRTASRASSCRIEDPEAVAASDPAPHRRSGRATPARARAPRQGRARLCGRGGGAAVAGDVRRGPGGTAARAAADAVPQLLPGRHRILHPPAAATDAAST